LMLEDLLHIGLVDRKGSSFLSLVVSLSGGSFVTVVGNSDYWSASSREIELQPELGSNESCSGNRTRTIALQKANYTEYTTCIVKL
jgi:hypothetical protein